MSDQLFYAPNRTTAPHSRGPASTSGTIEKRPAAHECRLRTADIPCQCVGDRRYYLSVSLGTCLRVHTDLFWHHTNL